MKCSNCHKRKQNWQIWRVVYYFNGLGKTKHKECFCSLKCAKAWSIRKGVKIKVENKKKVLIGGFLVTILVISFVFVSATVPRSPTYVNTSNQLNNLTFLEIDPVNVGNYNITFAVGNRIIGVTPSADSDLINQYTGQIADFSAMTWLALMASQQHDPEVVDLYDTTVPYVNATKNVDLNGKNFSNISILQGTGAIPLKVLNGVNVTNGSLLVQQTTRLNGNVFLTNLTSAGIGANAICLTGTEQTANSAVSCTISSKRYKENITALESVLSRFMNLNPSRFNYINNSEKRIGLVAEDIITQFPELAAYDKNGLLQTYRPDDLNGIYVKVIQEQQKEIDFMKLELCKKDKHYAFC